MFQTVAALLVFLFPLACSPGPGNMFFAANGAWFGFGATIPASLGYHIATWDGDHGPQAASPFVPMSRYFRRRCSRRAFGFFFKSAFNSASSALPTASIV